MLQRGVCEACVGGYGVVGADDAGGVVGCCMWVLGPILWIRIGNGGVEGIGVQMVIGMVIGGVEGGRFKGVGVEGGGGGRVEGGEIGI